MVTIIGNCSDRDTNTHKDRISYKKCTSVLMCNQINEAYQKNCQIHSHISGDLEHFCDDLYMIHEGKIVLHEETDRILEEYGFLKVSEQEYEALDKEYLLRVRKESFGYSCLTNQKNYYLENYPGIIVEKGSVDEVISMLVKGELL